jgi:hypothetical protein
VYVRFRSPSLLSSEAIDGRRRDLQMNEGKVEHTTDTLFGVLLATGSCNWRRRGWERGLHRFGAEAISLLLAIGYIRCPQGQDPVRRDEKRKVSSKCRPNETANQPPIQPTNQPTSQKTKLRRAQGGSKNLLKRRQVRKPFFSGLIFRSLVSPAWGYD